MSIANNLHTDLGLNTYAQGMSNSAPDKSKLVNYIQPGSVLEIGCGNGVVLKLAADALKPDGSNPWVGADMNAKLLSMAAENLKDWPVDLIRAAVGKGGFREALKPYGKFDNIIFCSTLHEIYSEDILGSLSFPMQALTGRKQSFGIELAGLRTIKELLHIVITEQLNPGGRIIIRDGIKPEDVRVQVTFRTEFGKQQFYKFVDDYPRFIPYREQSLRHGTVELSSVDLFEFMTKYFYLENWEVEVKEVFGWTSAAQFQDMFKNSQDVRVVSLEEYTIDWLRDKWAADFDMQANGEPYCFPSTFIAVLEKRG